ncbi:hypothetical protein NDU88_004345 [Pleurodeles waltl]|uniref:Uncharacterized protein n=1 Tax=Pleurodeles waltl TaxID=8319 RepID=A0AAV7M633_PLEWA|nr:hypothetical protein NDU88_004345 [Pleurodeles waltl]
MDNTLVSVWESATFSPAPPQQIEPSTVEDAASGQATPSRQILPAAEEAETLDGSLRNPSDNQGVPSGRSRGGRYHLWSNLGPYRRYPDFIFD